MRLLALRLRHGSPISVTGSKWMFFSGNPLLFYFSRDLSRSSEPFKIQRAATAAAPLAIDFSNGPIDTYERLVSVSPRPKLLKSADMGDCAQLGSQLVWNRFLWPSIPFHRTAPCSLRLAVRFSLGDCTPHQNSSRKYNILTSARKGGIPSTT
jgi:hypothetical protein